MKKEFIELGLNTTPEREEAQRREKVKRDIVEKYGLSPEVLVGIELHNDDEEEMYSITGTVQGQRVDVSFNSFNGEFRGTIEGRVLDEKEAQRLFWAYRDLNHEIITEAIIDKYKAKGVDIR